MSDKQATAIPELLTAHAGAHADSGPQTKARRAVIKGSRRPIGYHKGILEGTGRFEPSRFTA